MLATVLTGLAVCWLVVTGIALARVDLRHHRLPNKLVAAAGAGAVILVPAAALATGALWPVGRAVLAATTVLVILLGIALAAPGHLGYGDVKLGAVLALYLGWFGWRQVFVGLAAGFLLGAVAALGLVARRRSWRTRLPLGPALLAGAIGTLLVAATACTSSSEPNQAVASPSTTTTTTSPSQPTPTTSTSTASDAPAEQLVLAAYTGMWMAMADAGRTSDWQSPELARFARDDALVTIVQTLYSDHERGITSRGRPVLRPEVTDLVPVEEPNEARVLDCGDDRGWRRFDADGQLVDVEPGGQRRITAIVVFEAESWKVVNFAIQEVGSC